MSRPVAVIHPGTQHSWQTAQALQELDRLAFFATSIFRRPDRWPYRAERLPGRLGRALAREFRRFDHPALDPALVRTGGWEEWAERIATRLDRPRLADRLDRLGNDRFVRVVARDLRSDRPFSVWSYDGVAAKPFQLARATGRRTILDRTIGDWRAYNEVLIRLADEWPEFLDEHANPVESHKIARQDEEYAAADVILLGSDFAAGTVRRHALAPGTAAKVRVLPYNFDAARYAGLPPPTPCDRSGPVRFLFVGQLGVRKGAHLLLEAARRIPPSAATFTVLGAQRIPPAVFARYADRVRHLPSVPRGDVAAVMARHDALVFPSYFEGAGIVLYEALRAGLALIQSDQADVAVTPATGLLLPELSVDALHDALMTAIEDRDRLDGWRAAAPESAERYTFAAYRARVAALLDELDAG